MTTKHKFNAFRLWITDVFLNGFIAPYDVVDERYKMVGCYTLKKAMEYSIVSSDHYHHLSIGSLSGRLTIKWKTDTKGRTRFPKAILRRLGRIL